MKFAFKSVRVDYVTVGYKNTAEIDETIEHLSQALAGQAVLRWMYYPAQSLLDAGRPDGFSLL
jgi:hypothetical protein